MRIKIRLFAAHRDIIGQPQIELELEEPATISDVWALLQDRYPSLQNSSVSFAINHTFATPGTPVHEGDEVAFIPPVSGGAETPAFLITSAPLDARPLEKLVQTPRDGAVVTFAGVVRDNFAGRATAYLEYEAYAEMAEPVLEKIAQEAQAQWTIGRVAIHHRIGRLEIGEMAVLVVVAAPHRHEAFAAASSIMDRIKEIAPIWKREVYADGAAEWVGDEKTRKADLL